MLFLFRRDNYTSHLLAHVASSHAIIQPPVTTERRASIRVHETKAQARADSGFGKDVGKSGGEKLGQFTQCAGLPSVYLKMGREGRNGV